MTNLTLQFPRGFAWGTATAAFQIEGGHNADGKGPSIWDTYSADASRIADGKNAKVSCDHYHRYPEDIDLMAQLGYRNYRFSLSWPRIFPRGRGNVNPAGLDFYDMLVDELLANDITPFVTLFHWDLPQALQDEGGWANRRTADAFADYGETVARRLGDRVKNWMTHNEPWVHAFVGHLFGHHAPGISDLPQALQTAHNILLSHGLVIPVIRRASPGARIGLVNNLEWIEPASDGEADIQAAKRHDGAFNRWYLDSVFHGQYPGDMCAWYKNAMPEIQEGDMQTIATPCDFLGVNYYTRRIIAHEKGSGFLHTRQVRWPFVPRAQYEEWENNPEGLYRLLLRLQRDYGNPPIYISENGTSLEQDIVVDGICSDPDRTEYIRRHAAAVWQAIQDGSDIRGYFAWSLLDNFEWNFGYSKRFGLIHVDFDSLKRTVKESGHWFSRVCKNNGFSL